MIDLREVNYRSLKRQFFDLSDASKAARRIDSASSGAKSRALTFLLRHHDEEPISDAETWKRDAFDELLHYYSIMEIASLLGLIPRPLPIELQDMAFRHLRHSAVNKYFVSNYPLVLPQIFLLRLGGYVEARCVDDSSPAPGRAFPLFLQLLQLDSKIHGGDEDVDTLLWFLDGGSIDDYDIEDTLDALKNAKTFFRCLSVKPNQMTPRDSSLQGLVTFLDFCLELDSFLNDRNLPALLRYEAWHLYGYWFGNLGTILGDRLKVVIQCGTRWNSENRMEAKQDKKENLGRLRGAVERLVSGEYGRLPRNSMEEAAPPDLTEDEAAALDFLRKYPAGEAAAES